MAVYTSPEQDVFAAWSEGLEPIEPLIEYYSRQMGQLSGRLMTALSFLADLEDGHDWDRHPLHVQDAVHYSRLLIASVLKLVAAAQADESDRERRAAEAIREALRYLANGKIWRAVTVTKQSLLLPRAIRKARQKRRWTQVELAQRLGVSQGTISFWERGGESPSLTHQVQLVALMPEIFEQLAKQHSEILSRLYRLERVVYGGKCSCSGCGCST